MALFAYRAHAADGTLCCGEVAADSRLAALAQIRGQGLFVAGLEEKKAARPSLALRLRGLVRRRSPREEALFVRQLSVLLGAGLTLYDALSALGEAGEDGRIASLQREIAAGRPLSEALRAAGGFAPLSLAVVAVGEASGELPLLLARLADWLTARERSREKLKTVLTYPLLLLGETVGIAVFLLAFVLPAFSGLFLSLGADLPWPTRLLLGASDFLAAHVVFLLLAGGALLLGLRYLSGRPPWRERLARLRLRGPLFGVLAREAGWMQLLRALSVLLACGVPPDVALGKAGPVAENAYLARRAEELARGLREGFSLSEQLRGEPTFPRGLLRLLKAGELAGREAEMLGRAADDLEMLTENHAARLQALAEPCAYLVIFALVGLVVAAVALPWLDLMTLIV